MEKGGGIIAVKTASSTLHDINVGFLLRPNYNDFIRIFKNYPYILSYSPYSNDFAFQILSIFYNRNVNVPF